MNQQATLLAALAAFCAQATVSAHTSTPAALPTETATKHDPLVQLAILLDTSGSMKGLVDQARCQFWEIVDDLARAEQSGQKTRIEVAVLEYGNSNARKDRGFVRTVVGFTDDLDVVSRALFALDLEGGDEFCATAINTASNELEWSEDERDYRAIVIAGNESFNQGSIPFGGVLPKLQFQDITLNTIYCRWKKAEKNEAMPWRDAAGGSGGRFLEIDHNLQLPDIATPYDGDFRQLNERMNATFVWYGDNAKKARKNQIQQDRNAANMSNRAFAGRMATKIGHLYHHVHSDLVDAIQHGHVDLSKMPVKLMPTKLQAMSSEQRQDFMDEMLRSRESVRRDMADLITKRHAWLRARNEAGDEQPTWGSAFRSALREQAGRKGFRFGDASTAALTGNG